MAQVASPVAAPNENGQPDSYTGNSRTDNLSNEYGIEPLVKIQIDDQTFVPENSNTINAASKHQSTGIVATEKAIQSDMLDQSMPEVDLLALSAMEDSQVRRLNNVFGVSESPDMYYSGNEDLNLS